MSLSHECCLRWDEGSCDKLYLLCWNGSSQGIIRFYKVKNKQMLVPWQLFVYLHSLFYILSVVLLHTHTFASETLLRSKDVACIETVIFHSKSMQISPTCALLWSVISGGWGLKQLSLTQSEARFNTTFSPSLAHCAVLRTHTLTHRQRL